MTALAFPPSASPLALGIDIGGTTIKLGLVQNGAVIKTLPSLETQEFRHADLLIGALLQSIVQIRRDHPTLAAIGIGVPGFVDVEQGVVHQLTNVPGWSDVPLRSLITKEIGLPSFVDNDANAMAYGEWKFGASADFKNILFVTLGTGVGGGLILDGRMYRGARSGAGEVGQMSIDPRDPDSVGHYGNFGALEKSVGNLQIAMRATALYTKAGHPHRSLEDCTPAALHQAACDGDVIATEIWRETGEMIGFVLTDIVWLLNLDAIIIGGGIAAAGEFLFEPIRKTIRARTNVVFSERLSIFPATLGNDAGMIGSAQLALDSIPTALR